MAYKSAAPCDLFREHVTLNPGSFATAANSDSGSDFRFDAITEGVPTRQGHVHDNTAWPSTSQPKSDSWVLRLRGAASNANANQEVRGGQLT